MPRNVCPQCTFWAKKKYEIANFVIYFCRRKFCLFTTGYFLLLWDRSIKMAFFLSAEIYIYLVKKWGCHHQINLFLMGIIIQPKLLAFLETRINLLSFGKIRFFFGWHWYCIKVGSFDRATFRENRHTLFHKNNFDCSQWFSVQICFWMWGR